MDGFECVKRELEIVIVLSEGLGTNEVKRFDFEKEIESLIKNTPTNVNEVSWAA